MADTVEQILNPKAQGYLNRQADIKNEQAAANSAETETPEFKPMQFYDEFINSQNGYKPEDEQERKAREKQERTNKIIAGVGDMISALANMYYTTKGAPNSYDPREGMTPKMQARYDQLQKEREAREKDYLSGLQRARQLDQQYNLSWQQLKEQRERWKAQDEERRQKQAEDKAYKEQMLEIARMKQEEQNRTNMAKEEIQRNKANNTGRGRGGRGRNQNNTSRTTTVYDKNGKPIKTTTVESGIHTPTRVRGSLLP